MTIKFKSCQRCGGDVAYEDGHAERVPMLEAVCIQCGNRREIGERSQPVLKLLRGGEHERVLMGLSGRASRHGEG